MKNLRSMLFLSVILVLTIAAHFFLHYQSVQSEGLVKRLQLVGPFVEQAFRITVEKEGCPKTELVNTRRWRMTEPYSAVADENVVLKMIDSFITTEIEASTSDQDLLKLGRTREDFGLGNPKLKVSLTTKNKTTEISFGSITPSNDGYYVSVSGEDAVYVVPTNTFLVADLPPEGFRRRSVFSVGSDAVTVLDIKRGTGSFLRFTHSGEFWQMIQPQKVSASSSMIKKLLDGMMNSSANDFIWPTGAKDEPVSATTSLLASYGLDSESATTVTVKCFDGTDRQISFGQVAKDGFVYALIHHSSAIVTLPSELKDLASMGIDEFTDMRVFPLSESSIARVSVVDGETTYLLARNESGAWFLDSPVSASTDRDSVAKFLSHITSLKSKDCSSNGVTIAVSPGDKAMVFPRKVAFGNFQLDSLRSREIVRIEPESVRRIVLTDSRKEKPTAIVYDSSRRVWNVESSQKTGVVSEEAVSQLLSALNPLMAEEIVKMKVSANDLRNFHLDEPFFTIAIDLEKEDTLRRNILIGRTVRGGRYATLGSSDAVFVLATEIVSRLTSTLLNDM